MCKASASMMTASVKGKTREEYKDSRAEEFRDMATGQIERGEAAARRMPAARGPCGRARPADARQVRDPAVAYAARRTPLSVADASTESENDPMHAPIGDA